VYKPKNGEWIFPAAADPIAKATWFFDKAFILIFLCIENEKPA
jgi:uncharacterized membrane protein